MKDSSLAIDQGIIRLGHDGRLCARGCHRVLFDDKIEQRFIIPGRSPLC